MRVRATAAFRFMYNHVPIEVSEGDIIEADIAVFLLNAHAAVELLDRPGDDLDPTATPDGTIEEILAWVGDDTARVRQALEAEQTGKARSTLIAKLEALIPPPPDPSSDPAAGAAAPGE